jgi:hypothetical protein
MAAAVMRWKNSQEWGYSLFFSFIIFFLSNLYSVQNFTFINCGKQHIIRYAYPWWKEKVINSTMKRLEGLCPLTPEDTALVFSALGIDRNVQIYIAAGEIYGGEKRMASLAAAFPNLVSIWSS